MQVTDQQKRRFGTLLGLAVGDALGAPNEFRTLAAPPFPVLAEGPLTEMVGGGPFNLDPGQVTDDTHMAICLLDSIHEELGYDAATAAQRYSVWSHHTFDIGNLTRRTLELWDEGVDPADCGRKAWEESGRRSAGNGSLMRCAPIGLFYYDDLEARRIASLADSRITHFDPRCQLACAVFNAAIATGIEQGAAQDCICTAREELKKTGEALLDEFPELTREVDAAVDSLNKDLDASEHDDPDLYGKELHIHRTQGFVRVAFRLAFWELLHAPSFEAAMVDVVNRGGDADTNGAIVGALLGAVYGSTGIPDRWSKAIINAKVVAIENGSAYTLWGNEYHPNRFFTFLASLGT